MRLIEFLPYALCRFHTRSFILHSDVRFMMRIECASNTVNAFTRTSKRLRFPLFTWKYLHFLYMLHFFPSLLFSGSFVQCAQLFLQFLTFPMPGRSMIIALNGDVQPRIKAPFPFQNILSKPWFVKIRLTDGTSCWIHLVKPWIYGLSSILHWRKNGPSE
jgi:hypothetical protein